MKARWPGHPQGTGKATWSSAGACKIDYWMQSLDEGTSGGEVRLSNTPAHCIIGLGRQHQWQVAPRIPRGSWEGSTSSGGRSSDRAINWSYVYSAVTRASHNSHRPVHEGRGLQVKINLPIIKDKKTKDAVTYHSWWWDMDIFHCSGWDMTGICCLTSFNHYKGSWAT